jgi:hypothetical protein
VPLSAPDVVTSPSASCGSRNSASLMILPCFFAIHPSILGAGAIFARSHPTGINPCRIYYPSRTESACGIASTGTTSMEPAMRVTIRINDRVVCVTPLGLHSTSSWNTWTGSRRRSCPPSARPRSPQRRSSAARLPAANGRRSRRYCRPRCKVWRGNAGRPARNPIRRARRNGPHQLRLAIVRRGCLGAEQARIQRAFS